MKQDLPLWYQHSQKFNLEDSNQLNEIGFLQLKAKLIPEIQPPLTQRSPSHFHKI